MRKNCTHANNMVLTENSKGRVAITSYYLCSLYLDSSTMFRIVMDYSIFPMMSLYVKMPTDTLAHQILFVLFARTHALISIHLCLVVPVLGTPGLVLIIRMYHLH